MRLIDIVCSVSSSKYSVELLQKTVIRTSLGIPLGNLRYIWDISLVIRMVLEFCSNCNQGYLKPTQMVVLEGEVGFNFLDIGNKRIFVCDSCGQKQVKIRKNEYIKIRNDVKTRPG